MNLRPTRLVPVLFATALALGLLPVHGASAAPVDDKRAEAARLQQQIDANGRKIDELSEEGNGARYRLEQATADRDEAQARIDAARAEATRLRGLLQARAVNVYKGAGNTSPLDAIDVKDTRQYAARTKYATAAASSQNKLVDQLRDAQEELAARKQEFEMAIEEAQAEQRRIEAARQEIEAANARQNQLLGQVEGELAELVRQEEQRKEAEAAARARALTAPRPASSRAASGGGGSSDGGNWAGPPASGGAAAAIAFARAQIGKPYVYAAAGPDAYDCSGLTMRAWQAGGVSMPHYSGAQMAMFPQVSMDALQPGDLIFWGPGGSSHVALYSGGGMVVYAPQTGSFVKEAPIYGSPSGAVRPG
jgi:cell wall-associated NlpC family hydrolase